MAGASPGTGREFPWWLVATLGIGAWLGWRIVADELYREIGRLVVRGLGVTVFVTVVAFSLAALIGLALAVSVLSNRVWLRQLARFWIEIVRGVPMLVLLLYVAFVGTPLFVESVNAALAPLGLEPMTTRDIPLLWRAIAALTIGYSAFVAEVFRAGLQSVDAGQIEAAEALGLGPWQRFRHIVLPQAIRTVLPPLGNDFVAMIKDSSLVSVLGVADITQLGKVYAAGSFRYLETYNVVAYAYLFLTLVLSLALRALERRLDRQGRARRAARGDGAADAASRSILR